MQTNTLSQIEIAFIIVNYNTVDLLQTCVTSIVQNEPSNHLIVVVDNNSSDGSCEMIQTHFPTVKLIQNNENLGFPKAVNQGLQAASASFYFILNSDIVILENTVSILHDYLVQKPKCGIAAPAQILPNGDPILSTHQFPTLKREWARNLLFADVWQYRLRGQQQARKITEPISVDWVMGAALFVRTELMANIGYMDEAIFMYGEELDWCYRAHLAGWTVDFVPNAILIHHKSASADKAFNVYRYMRVVKSNYYVYAKQFGMRRLPLFVMAQLSGSLLRMIISGCLCLLGKKSFCYQAREHWLVIKASLDPDLYKWIKKAIKRP